VREQGQFPVALDRWQLVLLAIAVCLIAALWALGLLTAQAAPDTAGYFASASGDLWGSPRNPLYGWAARLLGAGPDSSGIVGVVQVALLVVAAFLLYFGAQAGGIGRAGAFFLAAAGLLSQSGLFHARLLVPEAPAISLLMMAFAGTLAASRGPSAFWRYIGPIALATGAAYLLRPSFLPAIFVVPFLWMVFAIRNGQQRIARAALLLLLTVASPFIVQSAIRWRAVSDFNIVSFGGYQMSPMAGFMLTPDLVAGLPAAVQPTGAAVLAARETAESAGRVARTPENSSGGRSFASAALGYFDIYARSYDGLLVEIAKLRRPDESWISFDRRLRDFSVATLMRVPDKWLAWVGGATARFVGHAIVSNATMLLACLALLVTSIIAAIWRGHLAVTARDLAPVCAVALAWLAATGPLIVLMTFPATRYIDTAGVLLAAIPATLAAAIIGRLLEPVGTASDSEKA
jgi:hypothetical protein